MSIRSMLVNTATRYAVARGVTATGREPTRSGSQSGTSFPCSFQPQEGEYAFDGEEGRRVQRAILYYEPGVTVNEGDMIGVDVSTVLWRVMGQPKDAAGRGRLLSVDLEWVSSEGLP